MEAGLGGSQTPTPMSKSPYDNESAGSTSDEDVAVSLQPLREVKAMCKSNRCFVPFPKDQLKGFDWARAEMDQHTIKLNKMYTQGTLPGPADLMHLSQPDINKLYPLPRQEGASSLPSKEDVKFENTLAAMKDALQMQGKWDMQGLVGGRWYAELKENPEGKLKVVM